MAQPTVPKLETTNCRKIDDGNPNNLANTDNHAYSETPFGGPTIGCVMTENWNRFCEDVSDRHLGHTENRHKKTVPRIRFVNHIEPLLE